MNMKSFIRGILEGLLDRAVDNLNRARKQFSRYTPEQMAKPYGESGETCIQVLASYESDVEQVKGAIAWLSDMDAADKNAALIGLSRLWLHVVDLTHGDPGPTDANTIYHLTALKHSFWGAWLVLPCESEAGRIAFRLHGLTYDAIEDIKAGWK